MLSRRFVIDGVRAFGLCGQGRCTFAAERADTFDRIAECLRRMTI